MLLLKICYRCGAPRLNVFRVVHRPFVFPHTTVTAAVLDGDSIFTSGGFRTRSFSPTSTNSWYYYSRGLCTASSQVYNGSTKEQTHLEKTTEYDGDSKNELDCFNDSHTGSEDEDDCDFSDSNDIEDNKTDSLRTKENFWTTEYNDVVDPERIVSKPLKTPDIKRLVKSFSQSHITQAVARENRLSGKRYKEAIKKFGNMLMSKKVLARDNLPLYNTLVNIFHGSGVQDDLIPYFIDMARQKFSLVGPRLELSQTSDLRSPATWFPSGRSVNRKIIYHAGPTNSGKTHAAIQRFMSANNAIYCAPLRMLAHEIFHRSNKEGVPCDLLTGEEAQFASEDETKPASRISCTVEMANINPDCVVYDVAVIDEVQMLQDFQRGGGWTRALLGLPAYEIHVCGDHSAIDLVSRMAGSAGENVEVMQYERLSPLLPLKKSLQSSFKRIGPGDCVVTFSRRNVFKIREEIERHTKHKCAVIYGGLPSATRVTQAELFNNPESEHNVLVATDAVGMGLNLNIRRMIFHSMKKYDGSEGDLQPLNPSQVKQIAGRAGRFGKDYTEGQVTTFHESDLPELHSLLQQPLESIPQAGIYPRLEQILAFSQHLKNEELYKILSLFSKMAQLDGNYFLCDMDVQMSVALMLSRLKIEMEITDAYSFSLASVDLGKPETVRALATFAKNFVLECPVDSKALYKILKLKPNGEWQQGMARTVEMLAKMEVKHEILDTYLRLSMRYPDIFVSPDEARLIQEDIEKYIDISLNYSSLKLTTSNNRPRKPMKLKMNKWKRERTR